MKTKQSISAGQLLFIKKYRRKQIAIHLLRIVLLASFIILWEISANTGIIDSFIFSSPSRLIKAFKLYSENGTILSHTLITLEETVICFSIVIITGLVIAVIFWWNEMIFKVFEPFLVVLNSLPKSALAPLFIVWLGTNMKTIVIAAVSVAVFGAVLSLYEHFRQTDQEQIKLIYTLGGSKLQVLIKVVIPANLPFILNIMKVNMGLSLVGVIIGEFVAANSGIGYLILYSSQIFKLDLMILSIIILAFIASVFYIILDLLEKRIIKK